jgi:hypothetical protein
VGLPNPDTRDGDRGGQVSRENIDFFGVSGQEVLSGASGVAGPLRLAGDGSPYLEDERARTPVPPGEIMITITIRSRSRRKC